MTTKGDGISDHPITTADERRTQDFPIIVVAAAVVLGLILVVRGEANLAGTTVPIQSANDLSRWATIYSLVERGTYDIDETPWPPSIDRIRLNGHYYSSKPPLFPSLLAAGYLLLKKVSFGQWNLRERPATVVRIIVVTVNLLPFVFFLIFYSRLLDRLARDPWVRTYAMLAAALGTFLTGFSITLNNHTIAAAGAFFALYPAYLIWYEKRRQWWLFAVSGFFAAFAAVNELPSLAFLAILAAGLLWKARKQTFLYFLPLALIPVAANFWTNLRAVGSLAPAYAKKEAYDFPGSYWMIDPTTQRLVSSRTDPATGRRVIRNNIDGQYEPWYVYVFHMLIGHHGIFSLSPIFLLSVVGVERALKNRESMLRALAVLTTFLSLLLLVFYTFFAGQRNYGGATSGLRWTFWLIPLWLIFIPAGLARIRQRRWLCALALAFLFLSVMSVAYSAAGPWRRPWLHELMGQMGWITY